MPNDSHAQLYIDTTKAVTGAIVGFAEGVAEYFDITQVGRMFLGSSIWLLAAALGREGAIAQLNSLVAALERGDDAPPIMN